MNRKTLIHVGLSASLTLLGGSSLHAQTAPVGLIKGLSNDQLLELVQKQTFRYFWDFAHPVSGLSRERSNRTHYGDEVVTIGGTGFGVMSVIVATDRKFIQREAAVNHLLKMTRFLMTSDRFHGIFPHWMDGATGKTIPFSKKDNGADLVETAFLFQGLLCARQYFDRHTESESSLRDMINQLWREAEWDWFTQNGKPVLYWHWSPDYAWEMNHPIRGWNECLITYVLAASSPTHSIAAQVYEQGWKQSTHYRNQNSYHNIQLPLGFDYGGPLFFAHYSFLGLNPTGLRDEDTDYWEQNKNHSLIHYRYCIDNPKKYTGYGKNCWGLTASDSPKGYAAHSPTNDLGVISPTAALSSFPYTPVESMQALRYFYDTLGHRLWTPMGFADAFSESVNWVAESHLAIDQGPIIIMIENHRTGLLWNLFMSCPEISTGLKKLGFRSPYITM